jgi:hypothetical protein
MKSTLRILTAPLLYPPTVRHSVDELLSRPAGVPSTHPFSETSQNTSSDTDLLLRGGRAAKRKVAESMISPTLTFAVVLL